MNSKNVTSKFLIKKSNAAPFPGYHPTVLPTDYSKPDYSQEFPDENPELNYGGAFQIQTVSKSKSEFLAGFETTMTHNMSPLWKVTWSAYSRNNMWFAPAHKSGEFKWVIGSPETETEHGSYQELLEKEVNSVLSGLNKGDHGVAERLDHIADTMFSKIEDRAHHAYEEYKHVKSLLVKAQRAWQNWDFSDPEIRKLFSNADLEYLANYSMHDSIGSEMADKLSRIII
jgi:hypothetical protein